MTSLTTFPHGRILKFPLDGVLTEVTKPIIKTGNIIFLKLNDRRTSSINNSNIINIRNQIINKKKNEMLSLYSNNYLSKLKNKALIEIKYE